MDYYTKVLNGIDPGDSEIPTCTRNPEDDNPLEDGPFAPYGPGTAHLKWVRVSDNCWEYRMGIFPLAVVERGYPKYGNPEYTLHKLVAKHERRTIDCNARRVVEYAQLSIDWWNKELPEPIGLVHDPELPEFVS